MLSQNNNRVSSTRQMKCENRVVLRPIFFQIAFSAPTASGKGGKLPEFQEYGTNILFGCQNSKQILQDILC